MRYIISCFVAVFLAATFSTSSFALEVPPAPPLETPIVDQTKTLTDPQIMRLAEQIAKSRQEKSYQIGILIIPTLGKDEYLEGYSLKVARAWGIGEKEKSNGVLLLAVMNDRKLRIEVGRGLEGDLTDVRASRIIRNIISPEFKSGFYYKGISAGVESIQLAVAEKADPAAETDQEPVDWSAIIATAFFSGFAVLSWLGAILGRSKSWWVGGIVGGVVGLVVILAASFVWWSIATTMILILAGLGFDYLVSKNYKQHTSKGTSPSWWAGGNWGSGGGSSGGSFGGGGFSGGGASGGW